MDEKESIHQCEVPSMTLKPYDGAVAASPLPERRRAQEANSYFSHYYHIYFSSASFKIMVDLRICSPLYRLVPAQIRVKRKMVVTAPESERMTLASPSEPERRKNDSSVVNQCWLIPGGNILQETSGDENSGNRRQA